MVHTRFLTWLSRAHEHTSGGDATILELIMMRPSQVVVREGVRVRLGVLADMRTHLVWRVTTNEARLSPLDLSVP